MSTPKSSIITNLVKERKAASKAASRPKIKDETVTQRATGTRPSPGLAGDAMQGSVPKSIGGVLKVRFQYLSFLILLFNFQTFQAPGIRIHLMDLLIASQQGWFPPKAPLPSSTPLFL
jgi:hypothetical protein